MEIEIIGGDAARRVLDQPDFLLQVEGSGGVSDGVPGFYLDELNIDVIGGSFTVQNVPIAVLDVTNPKILRFRPPPHSLASLRR